MSEVAEAVRKGKRTKPEAPPVLPPGCDALLSKQQICFAVGVSVRTLEGMISAAEFPGPDAKVGAFPRWRVPTLNAWIAGLSKPNRG